MSLSLMDAEADWGRAAAHYVVSILRLPDPLVEHDMHMIRAFVASLHDTTDTHRESVNTPFQLSGQATHTRTHTYIHTQRAHTAGYTLANVIFNYTNSIFCNRAAA